MHRSPAMPKPADSPAQSGHLGLIRQELMGPAPARTLKNLFSDLRSVNRSEFIGEDALRHLQGARLLIDRTEGQGTWELYRLGEDLFVVAADGVYDSPRGEVVPGEGLVEIHLRLAGVLELTLPGTSKPLLATGPCVLLLHQPLGVDVSERVLANRRDTGVSLYCRPEYLAGLVRRNSIFSWPLLEEIESHYAAHRLWHRILPLSPGLLYIARSLLQSTYRHGIRLLHAEAKSLEIICELVDCTSSTAIERLPPPTDAEVRQLDAARHILASQWNPPPRLQDVARNVGMSETKLKRAFKARYGVTVFDYSLECRMRHALELLRCKRLYVGHVAHLVGYKHQTSFTSAFREFFGFLPSAARNEMH